MNIPSTIIRNQIEHLKQMRNNYAYKGVTKICLNKIAFGEVKTPDHLAKGPGLKAFANWARVSSFTIVHF